MNTYKFQLHSGQSFVGEDKRDLEKLSADLCSIGFLVIVRRGIGYSTASSPISILERAVASIEPLDR